MSLVYLGLGSNQNKPLHQIDMAVKAINNIDNISIIKKSSIYETKPVGFINQPNFFNMVILIETKLNPLNLLKNFQRIEKNQKRVKKILNGPRTIDIDILIFEDLHMNLTNLIIPHPRMHERAFVMFPLVEIEPDIRIPKIDNIDKILGKLNKNDLIKIND